MKVRNKNKTSIQENRPIDWFEPLYADSNKNGIGVPWANMETHPFFSRWLGLNQLDGKGRSALVVGCGMGDDAIELEALGFEVTAFDVSETAIQFCKERFPLTKVNFVQADLLEDQPHWHKIFDFVLEIYTVQALPPKYEKELVQSISNFVAPDGKLLVIAEVSSADRTFENGPPWRLTPRHVDSFASCGLDIAGKTIVPDTVNPRENATYITTFSAAC